MDRLQAIFLSRSVAAQCNLQGIIAQNARLFPLGFLAMAVSLIAFGREALVMTSIGMNNAFQRLSNNLIAQTLAFSSKKTVNENS